MILRRARKSRRNVLIATRVFHLAQGNGLDSEGIMRAANMSNSFTDSLARGWGDTRARASLATYTCFGCILGFAPSGNTTSH